MPRSLAHELDDLRRDPNVAAWESNLRQGSRATADVFIRRLRAVCASLGKSPDELSKMPHDDLRNLLVRFREAEEARGKTAPYVGHELTVIRSWLKWSGAKLPTIKVDGVDHITEEDPLTRDEIRRALTVCTPRERVAIAIMAAAGTRIEVIGNYDGSDGLRVRDLPDLVIKDGKATFTRTPAMVVVRPTLSKARHQYLSFLHASAASIVADSLTARLAGGEVLGPNSPILASTERSKRPHIRAIEVGRAIQRAFRAAGLHRDRDDHKSREPRAYSLRTTWMSRVQAAENDGLIQHSVAIFMGGHKGDMSSRYSMKRGRIDPELVEQMRAAYAKAEKHLAWDGPSSSDARTEVMTDLLDRMLKASNEKGRSGPMTWEDLSAALREMTGKKAGQAPSPTANPTPSPQRLVAAVELPELLSLGWRYVAQVGDRIVVQPAGV